MKNPTKTPKQLERYFKGVSNHWRIKILQLIAKRGSVTFEEIVEALGANEKTMGEHTRRLHLAGLIDKKYRGRYVVHSLSPYGEIFIRFLNSFPNS